MTCQSELNSNILFYVQAGSSVGMGHLARSAALISGLKKQRHDCELFLDADISGYEVARSKGLNSLISLPSAPKAVIIDALQIEDKMASALRRYFPRILISPVCNRADLATHVLVRAAPPALLEKINPNAELIVNQDFTFATANGLTRKKHTYDRLSVGICLSSDGAQMLQSLLSVISGTSKVVEVRIIGKYTDYLIESETLSFTCISPNPHPWRFLDGINLFIGSDGLMIAEAIAQAIPVISLTTSERNEKNRFLQTAGAMKTFSRGSLDIHGLAGLLTDSKALSDMHLCAWHLNGSCRAESLGLGVVSILKEGKYDEPSLS